MMRTLFQMTVLVPCILLTGCRKPNQEPPRRADGSDRVATEKPRNGIHDRREAERFALVICADIALYNFERVAEVDKSQILTVLSSEISAGRQLFQKRIKQDLLTIYDQTISKDLPTRIGTQILRIRDKGKGGMEAYLKYQPYPGLDEFLRYQEFHQSVVAKIRSLGLKPGEKQELGLSSFDVSRPIKTCPAYPHKKPVKAYMAEDGTLYVMIRTLDLHHAGLFGYVFCDGLARSSLATEELFLGEGAPGQIKAIADHWYTYRAY